MLLFLQTSKILRTFVSSTDDAGWEDTATNWLVTVIVVAVVIAGVMLLMKWLRKKAAPNIREKTWSSSKTVIFVLVGLAPTLIALPGLWYATRNFHNYISVGGLFTGIAVSWLCYLVLILTGHLLSPYWRRDLF